MNEDIRNIIAVTRETVASLSAHDIGMLGDMILRARRVFIVGNGGSAAHASHFACDLTKLAAKPAICLNDNLASYSAGVNDDNARVYVAMLRRWGFGKDGEETDLLIALSVGGGSVQRGVSVDLVQAMAYGFEHGQTACIVGRRGDMVKVANRVVQIDCPVPELITPVVESVMPLVWHALVAGPLKREEPVWR